jgi:hypothetical protein
MPTGRLAPEKRANREVYFQLADLLRRCVEGTVALVLVDEEGDAELLPVFDLDAAAKAAGLRAGWRAEEHKTRHIVNALANLASEMEQRSEGRTLMPGGMARPAPTDTRQFNLFAEVKR